MDQARIGPDADGSRRRAPGIGWLIVAIVWLGGPLPPGPLRAADETLDQRNAAATPLAMDTIPLPPPAIVDLIQRGNVTFRVGPGDDGRAISPGRPMAAETGYRIEFTFRLSLRWRSSGDQISVQIAKLRFDWQPVHIVWLRRMPDRETFWQNDLVRHELDHVAISSHPSLRATFDRRGGELGRVRGVIRDAETARDAARRIASAAVTELFDEVSELAKIRYVELDRQTDHGLGPVPEGSELRRWLPPM